MGAGLKIYKLDKFPIKQEFSLEYLLQYCKDQYGSGDALQAFQSDFFTRAEQYPELFNIAPPWPLKKKHHSMFMELFSFIRSPYAREQEMIGITMPNSFEVFYATPKLEEAFGKNGRTLAADFFRQFGGETYFGPTLYIYGRILKEFYGADTYFNIPTMRFSKEDKKSGLIRYYDLFVDMRFSRILPVKKLPELSPGQLSELGSNFYDLDNMFEVLPPGNFVVRGFSMITVLESTGIRAVMELKDKLLEKDAILSKEHFLQLQKLMQSILNLDDLKMGIGAADFEAEGFQESNSTVDSLLVDSSRICSNFENSIFYKAVTEKAPVIIQDLDKQDTDSPVISEYRKQGYKSLIVIPLVFEERLVGILELASYKVNGLNNLSIIDLQDVIPAFSIAAARVSNDLRNKVKAKIQEEFTAIHSVVEWKFNRAASQLLDENTDSAVTPDPIIFKDVYPLYAAVDIRASSRERNNAIIRDLQEQLDDAFRILEKAWSKKKMPVFSQLNYQINNYRKSLKQGLLSGDETRIIDFLRREVEPVFKHFKTAMPELEKDIQLYENKIDPQHGMLYKKRNDFEISIGQLTDNISAIIDEQELSAQNMFPHYFEKYRTDGIEYNIYVGQSLLEELTFDPVYLKNLRLWELIVMCQIARKTEEIKPDLPIPLDTTQLVLVHSSPLDIRFRQDEKKFDVEGGYNIRYEIIKKRIDKAVIKESDQRLTQPGTIAIIYSQPNEYYEYKKYIDYLRSVNYLTGDTEELELEEMQGVFGLQALRVKINYKHNLKKELSSMDEIVKEAGKKIK